MIITKFYALKFLNFNIQDSAITINMEIIILGKNITTMKFYEIKIFIYRNTKEIQH